jgi:hypothetical protein
VASDPRAGRLCPSARCEPGSILLGVVTPDGRVGYLRPELRIDAEFVANARAGREPEKRFRFAQPCVEAECRHWTGSRCGVIENVLDSEEGGAAVDESRKLPRCSIRPRCRWFAEQGARACMVCPLVITEPPVGHIGADETLSDREGLQEEESVMPELRAREGVEFEGGLR